MQRFISLTASVMMMIAAAQASADEKPLDAKQVEEIVRKVIADNPDLIIKSLQNYEIAKRAEAVLKAGQNLKSSEDELKNNPNSPVAGNPKGDVTVVEFFDYHCGYCKKFFGEIKQVLEDDKNVRLVFKEFPILSEDSKLAARAALAVNSIDKSKYLAFHSALMRNSGGFNEENLTAEAKKIGIDEAAFKKALQNPDLEKELINNRKLAEALNISGTPGIIVGKEITPGAISAEELKAKIANVRLADKEKK